MDFVLTGEGCLVKLLPGLFAARRDADFYPGEFDAMGIVDEAIQDGVGVAWVSYRLMCRTPREVGT